MMQAEPNVPTPTAERIPALDVLRGFAVLGILIVNIQSFSMIGAAYFNPTAYGDLTGINRWAWLATHVLADNKFMTIFSILFGAGILLLTRRVDESGGSPAAVHYRRTLGLLVIGAIHAYLFWYGDILVWYGLCALLVYLFRKCSPKTLAVVGIICIAIPSLLYLLFAWSVPYWPPEAYQQMLRDWKPQAQIVEMELSAYRGGWLEQMQHRLPESIKMHTIAFLFWASWRAGGLMLLGMALLKWGVLTGRRSRRFYAVLGIAGPGIGLPVIIYGVVRNFEAGWSLEYSRFVGSQFNYWASLLVAMGYISLVMLSIQSVRPGPITRALSAVGRTALSNYLMQTLLCTSIFYGHGLGLFGQVERGGQVLTVLGIWLLQSIISVVWLKHFQFGPAEGLWRSWTYQKWQPLKISSCDSDSNRE